MTNCRAPYKTLCRKTGGVYVHMWPEAPSRHVITTDSRPRTCEYQRNPSENYLTNRPQLFKVNLSFGFILKQKVTGRLRYYHSSNNCCGRYMEEPALITNRADFDQFLERIQESDILQWAIDFHPSSLQFRLGLRDGDECDVLPQPDRATPNRFRRRHPARLREN